MGGGSIMLTYDVLFMADHFIMVTTVESQIKLYDIRDAEALAWKRLSDMYGDEWMMETKSHVNEVTVELNNTIPEPGDPEDAGIDR